MSFFTAAFSLFIVLNAIGNVPLFIALLSKFNVKKQRRIIFQELLIALFILISFNFFGDLVLSLLGISNPIIGIAGGILLFIIALGMIFPRNSDKKAESPRSEPFIVPLAIPIIAGPGAIATVMIFSEQTSNHWMMIGVILAAWIPSTLILLASANIKDLLGQKGLTACQKLGGMLILLISVQMFTSGLMLLLQQAFHVPK